MTQFVSGIASAWVAILLVVVADGGEVDFARDVQSILAKRCFACHGPDDAEGGLAFHSPESALVEADSGEIAIAPGDASASALIARITSDDPNEQMPPEGDRVTAAEIETLRKWIDEGAVFTKHWAFEPMAQVALPSGTAGNPIDAFLLPKLEAVGLTMNQPADRATLIRRVSYDLTGLPPTAAEMEAFIKDEDPQAYENLVDRLLTSHHYGERWGRHWLDLVRFGETNSFERDASKPNAWKYRDYVIRSFNEDKPYDQFIREQLAGDQIPEVTQESLTATGYYRLGIWDDEPADPLQARFDELDDLMTTTGQVFLGLTINCARCHDHKIDPIPQTDYYGMLAFFADVSRYGERGKNGTEGSQIDVSEPGLVERYQILDQQQQAVDQQLREIEQAGIVKMSAEDQRTTEGPPRERERILRKKLQQHLSSEDQNRYAELKASAERLRVEREQMPPRQSVLGLGELREVNETFVLFRGNPHSPTDAVTPRFPAIYEEPQPEVENSNRRLVLANWIADEENRLTSRVLVNRLWQHHFGRGIVRSSNNFGQLGTPPTHPELLDFLAQTFVDGGWRIKAMHRMILTSQAYQMSAQPREDGRMIDPGNDLFWRFDPRRLSAEEVRDSILMVNETLNRQPYGPSFYPKLSAEVLAGQSRPGAGWGDSSESDLDRRSVYIHVKRSLLTPMLSAFDFPEPDVTCEARFATLQPNQAMALLNSDFIHEEASILVKLVQSRLPKNQRNDPSELMSGLVRQVVGREATSEERSDAISLMKDLTEDFSVGPDRAATLLALSLLNWNEFVFVF